jgi:hypothetical protein
VLPIVGVQVLAEICDDGVCIRRPWPMLPFWIDQNGFPSSGRDTITAFLASLLLEIT